MSTDCSLCSEVGGTCDMHSLHEVTSALRAEFAASESLVTALQEQMARLVEQRAKAVAEAREEQREACARNIEAYISGQHISAQVRATPLDSTPLADRIAELEAVVRARDAGCNAMEASMKEARVALAAEVERHQATVKALETLVTAAVKLEAAIHSEPTMDGTLKSVHISPVRGGPALLRFKEALSEPTLIASLPAGPRVVR